MAKRKLPSVSLVVGTSRADMRPDNSPLDVIAALVRHGFTVSGAIVKTLSDPQGAVLSQSLSIRARCPVHEPDQWITRLVRVGNELSTLDMEIGEPGNSVVLTL